MNNNNYIINYNNIVVWYDLLNKKSKRNLRETEYNYNNIINIIYKNV